MYKTLMGELVDRVSAQIIAHAEELTELDQAIGDGDHGINMKRGFEAVAAAREELAIQPVNEALKAIGMQLVMKVGGASGPLYGTLFMTLGKQLGGAVEDRRELVRALAAAIDAVKARGKSTTGQKTMLDVLAPVYESLARGDSLTDLQSVTARAVESTREMKATRGRASFLGERSIGHIDPGARSSQLILEAVCAAVEAHHGG